MRFLSVPAAAFLLGWTAVAAIDGGRLSAQSGQGHLLRNPSILKPVADPSAEVREFIAGKFPAEPDVVIQVPKILVLQRPVTWDEQEMALAAWEKLRAVLGSLRLFREVRVRPPGRLLFRTAATDAAPPAGMSRTWLEVEGQLVDTQTGKVLGEVRVLADALGQAGTVSRRAAEQVPERVAEALARFVRRVVR
ncbi:MAG: hypothetical protein ACE5JS_11350 [Nitrospinota bacterium]